METNESQLTTGTTEVQSTPATTHAPAETTVVTIAANHLPVKVSATRRYVLLDKVLSIWGKIPQQQADLASILSSNLAVGVEVSEQDIFALVVSEAPKYASLRNSRQHPTYLFRYYRGLRVKGKHAGFTARGYLKVLEAQVAPPVPPAPAAEVPAAEQPAEELVAA